MTLKVGDKVCSGGIHTFAIVKAVSDDEQSWKCVEDGNWLSVSNTRLRLECGKHGDR